MSDKNMFMVGKNPFSDIWNPKVWADKQNCWVSPGGEIHIVDQYGHYDYAREVLGISEHQLELQCWMKLSSGYIHFPCTANGIPFFKLSKQQKIFIYDCVSHFQLDEIEINNYTVLTPKLVEFVEAL